MTPLRNPLIPGFNPDPSIVLVDGVYYLVTSSFEYLPGLPVYRSRDLLEWEHIGHVATRPDQIGITDVPTPGGVWAPTIRHHAGLFHVIVTVFLGGRGCVVFTADDPTGPWSDGVVIDAVAGIDPDLAWDEDGTAYVTYAAFGRGIEQLPVDLITGQALADPRVIWSGSGLLAPEGPHLYHRGAQWYLLIAEGGTDRGHAISIARGPSPSGPFEGFDGNPFLSARSTAHPVQNLGHADLVEAPDGGDAMVMLGVRPVDVALGFSPLGRETFATRIDWHDGWPVASLPDLGGGTPAEHVSLAFTSDEALDDPAWIGVRALPHSIARIEGAALAITSTGDGLTSPHPAFVGRRQRHHESSFSALVDATAGTGGIAMRMREDHTVAIEAHDDGALTTVVARAELSGLSRTWSATVATGPVRLRLSTRLLPIDLRRGQIGGERIALSVESGAGTTELVELDGRYWSYETAQGFTGRVVGCYAERGTVRFLDATYDGMASAPPPDATLASDS